ncbi:stress responsive alpha/beta barrel protein [Neobacillus bataviensis]|uniref:Stress responsive alpha/beta barrel protein n=1 Tax=Neobacillus bataviensis TaxID=220685 RepID=A0A561E0E1_9BACI|nr:Dabb family protein [Neobacillus bataviensis]TWE09096.1 stress responsive alpha/beta barrel protein [Neobacillus bataviensis]
MYEHIVTFKFNGSITSEIEQALLKQIKAFKGEIPGIVELTAGMNVTEEIENMHGYTLALRITFENKQALDHYLPHPTHQDFVASLNGIIDNVIVIDYEI